MLTLTLSLICLAPVPKRDLPPAEVTPGEYRTRWNNSHWQYTLSADGTLTGSSGPCSYVGIWSWDSKRRELMLCETCNEWVSWRWYVFRMDKDLSGRCIESSNTGEADEFPCGVTWTLKP